jgi:hypothetical protein
MMTDPECDDYIGLTHLGHHHHIIHESRGEDLIWERKALDFFFFILF